MVGLIALVAFAALMGVADPALPHHAVVADLLVPLFLLLWRRPAVSAPLIGYVGWAALSVALHREGVWQLAGIVELAAVWAAASTLREDGRAKVLHAWTMGAAVLASFSLIVSSLSGAGIITRWSAGGGELAWQFRPKGLAASTNLLASLCLVPFLMSVAQRRALSVLFGVTLLLSISRTILAALVGLILWWKPRGWRVWCGALLVAQLASIYIDIHGAGGPGIRARIVESALHTILAHPLFGVGPAQSPASAGWPGPNDLAMSWDAHSTALDVAARLGLPALLAFAAMFFARGRDRFLQICFWATAFDALTLDVERFRHVWLLLGLITATRREPRPPSAATAPATS